MLVDGEWWMVDGKLVDACRSLSRSKPGTMPGRGGGWRMVCPGRKMEDRARSGGLSGVDAWTVGCLGWMGVEEIVDERLWIMVDGAS